MIMLNYSKESCSESLKVKNKKYAIAQSSKLLEDDLKYKYFIEDNKPPAFFPGF